MQSRKNKSQEKINLVEKDVGLDLALKSLGYLLPETEEEMDAFSQMNGGTEIELPDHLTNPDFLFVKSKMEIVPQETEPTFVAGNFSQTKQNDYFKKLVLAAEIAFQLHEEPTFGHIKFVKIYCLCNEVCHMKLNTNYGKYAAGPLDPKHLHSTDAEFKKRKWFKIVNNGHGYRYFIDEKVEEYKKYYEKYFNDQLKNIERIIDLFRKKDSPFCEKVATLFFVWKEALHNNSIINESILFNGFYKWDESKKKYKEHELKSALDWMRNNGIEPDNNFTKL